MRAIGRTGEGGPTLYTQYLVYEDRISLDSREEGLTPLIIGLL